jgi:hypothetical protein
MKNVILMSAIAMLLAAPVAYASGDDHGKRRGNNTSVRTDVRQGQSQGQRQRQGQTQTATASGNQTNTSLQFNETYRERLVVASAIAPNLTSGMDTCLGSASAGLQTQIVGLSGGKTTVDENCVMIKQVHLLIEMGHNTAACYRARQNREIDLAMTAAGVECREPPPIARVVPAPAAGQNVEDVPVPYDRSREYK